MNDNTLIYAGIGSRDTPVDICKTMTTYAYHLKQRGYWLYSGGAIGADSAFEWSAKPKCTIFRPKDVTPEALELGEKYHPKWNALSEPSKLLIARNGFQVLGPSLKTPVKFIICWTKDGKASGGTGQALRIAEDYGIKVYNLFDPNIKIEELQ